MNPLHTFRAWFDEATAAGETEPALMALATASSDGAPSVRFVLLRGITDDALHFFTNYRSRKGNELAGNPRAAISIYWPSLGRQVRAEGPVERLSASASDAYFAQRPRGSQIAAVVSPQSEPVESIASLRAKASEMAATQGTAPVVRPAHWGGFGVSVSRIEFWIAGADRLHERTVHVREGAGWRTEVLGP
ncbi:MAG: pyridoxamine 5'-phosphate oxidase [Deltaproteobacteria bacterium]|nr:pyridoxamine 5'-phosphate oxidase [Deltaproteobacteria bacterium]